MADDPTKAEAWIVAFNKYVSVCVYGGTTAERTFAWGRANKALDNLIFPQGSHDTDEHPIVKKAA